MDEIVFFFLKNGKGRGNGAQNKQIKRKTGAEGGHSAAGGIYVSSILL